MKNLDFPNLYAGFHTPLTSLDCGQKCAPYNENFVPFCCDTRHAVPTAYLEEWNYLAAHSDLWHLWQADLAEETRLLQAQTPPNQILIECLGHTSCQRQYRTLTCRAFPFFPYIGHEHNFLGLSYYWEFEDRCWVISHLEQVTQEYIEAFIRTYDQIFEEWPTEMDQFAYHSRIMRQVFGRRKQWIPLLHRHSGLCLVDTRSDHVSFLEAGRLPKFGPYEVADALRFPDELD